MAEQQVKNIYTLVETVVDAEGKKHKFYPTPIGYVQEVAQFLSQVDPQFIFGSFMVVDQEVEDDLPIVKRLDNGKLSYGQSAVDELLSVLEIGVRFKETKEQIRKWLDIGTAQQAIEIMIGLSQVKKKTMEAEKNQTGTV